MEFEIEFEVDEIRYKVNEDDETVSVISNNYEGEVTIPDFVVYKGEKYSVTEIGNGAFMNCVGLTSIDIPNSVKIIRDEAFLGCIGLTSVNIPNSITAICSKAFFGCSCLENVNVPFSIDEIYGDEWINGDEWFYDNEGFYDKKDLYDEDWHYEPSRLTYLGQDAFSGTPYYEDQPSGLVYISDVLYKYKGTMPYGTNIKIKPGTYRISAQCFHGCNGLKSVMIPKTVAVIGIEAFYGCSGLTSIDIPNSVRIIGSRAFYGCVGLNSIVMPLIEGIRTNAFEGLSNLMDVVFRVRYEKRYCNEYYNENLYELPKGVIYFGDTLYKYNGEMPNGSEVRIRLGTRVVLSNAFMNCSGLTSVVIPDSVTDIGQEAFSGCSSLTSVVIPDSVTDIGENAFDVKQLYNNQSDGPLYIGKSLYKYIGEMPNGTEITIKEGTKSIGSCAFSGCGGLKSVVIPDSVTDIGQEAFSGCSSLTSVVIPDSVTDIGDRAFAGCSGLTSVVISNSVTKINTGVFSGCNGLTSVVVPDNVTLICWTAFSGCNRLMEFIISESIVIDYRHYSRYSDCEYDSYFRANYNNYFDFLEGVVYLDDTLYKYNGTMPDNSVVKIRVGTTKIQSNAFKNCNGLVKVVIPDSVTEIEEGAFENCSGLKSVVIPNSVTEIEEGAFKNCSGLKSVVIPNSVTGIGRFAFMGCSGLTSVVIPDSVTAIGVCAFAGCSGLTSIVIPNSVTAINSWAFSGCSDVESIVVGKDNPVYDSRENCNAIIETKTNKLIHGCKNTIIQDSVTEIGDCAFWGCSDLTSVVIPDPVTKIGDGAFECCIGLTSMVIPDSVTVIGEGAFGGCSGLTTFFYNVGSCHSVEDIFIYKTPEDIHNCDNLNTIVIGEIVKYIPKELFNVVSLRNVIVLAQEPPKCKASVSKNITVHVPKEAYVKYWLDDYWRNFNLCEFVPVESISLSEKDVYLNLDGKDTLQATISPTNATLKKVTWHSENLEVVTIDQEGNIYGVSNGITYVTAEALDGSGVVASCRVFVGMVNSIELTPDELRLDIHGVSNIECSVLPEGASNKAVEWSTTDDGVVAFRKNRDGSISVIGVSAGSAKILCKALDGGGACGVCDITVENR